MKLILNHLVCAVAGLAAAITTWIAIFAVSFWLWEKLT